MILTYIHQMEMYYLIIINATLNTRQEPVQYVCHYLIQNLVVSLNIGISPQQLLCPDVNSKYIQYSTIAAEERRKCIWCLIYLMSGSKAPDYDTYGLLRTTCSHNPTQDSHIVVLTPHFYVHIGAGHKVILPLVCEHTWCQTF